MKTFKIKLSQETINYVQRLGMDVDARAYVIDRMFQNHKNDTDTSLFESVPFKKYTEELAQVRAEYDLAVNALTDVIRPLVEQHEGGPVETFDWNIENFNNLEAVITIKE